MTRLLYTLRGLALCLLSTLFLVACSDTSPEPGLSTMSSRALRLEPAAKHFTRDADAAGGKAAILFRESERATFKLGGVPGGTYKVSVRARAEAYEGWPVMRLMSNGEQLGEDNPVERERYGSGAQKFGEVRLSEGQVVTARFLNDRYGGSRDKDRNLVIDYLILEPVEVSPQTPDPAPSSPAKSKKLIEYSWDVPTAEYVRDNIRAMEERPFDGLTFRIGKRDYISLAFDTERWAEADMQLDVLSDIEWGTFTDNFLMVWANTEGYWFDDEHWETVTANMRLLSKALDAADAKGILFDPEYYGKGDCHPWRYGTFDDKYDKPACDYGGRSLEEVEAQVRQRGSQFIDALETHVDDLDLISLHFMHVLYGQARWADTPLPQNKYALYRAFAEGMLDAADNKTRLVEGNEHAYYWSDTRHYSSVYAEINEDVEGIFTAPEYARLYKDKADVAFAASTDCVFVTPSFAKLFPGCDQGLSETEKALWFEQNIYNALLHSDEYVWLYSESGYHPGGYDTRNRMDWWSDPPQHVPPGAEQAIRRAKEKLEREQALGFNLGRKTERFADSSIPATFTKTPELRLSLSAGGEAREVRVESVNGEVAGLELYLDSVLVAESDGVPYTFELENLSSGQHTLFARGFSADGSHNTSNPVTVNVP